MWMIVSVAAVMAGMTAVFWQTDHLVALLPWMVASYLIVSLVLHELGHLVAGRLLGVRATAVYLGAQPGQSGIREIRIGGLPVYFGLHPTARVELPVHRASWPRLIYFAGPAVNLLQVAAVAVPAPIVVRLVLVMVPLSLAVGNLIPMRDRTGMWSDGARIFGFASPTEGREIEQRQRVLTTAFGLPAPVSPAPRADLAPTVITVCRRTLTSPTPNEADLELTAKRLQWLIENTPRTPRLIGLLALAALRSGDPGRAESLSVEALSYGRSPAAGEEAESGDGRESSGGAALPGDPTSAELADIHAVRALAAHVLGGDGRNHLRAAIALDRSGDLVREAVRAIAVQPDPIQR